MKITNALSFGREILRNQLEAEILLAFWGSRKREQLIMHPEDDVSPRVFKKFRSSCEKRRRGMPIAYITRHKEFYGLDFYVDERVLVPRPETELIVEKIINEAPSGGSICDVGTGSGCVAVALAKHLPQARITALDISAGALVVARRNAKAHGVADRIEFIKSDLLSAVMDRHFDVIAANLPYIGRSQKQDVEKGVIDFEPKKALFAGRTGLELFGRLFNQISKMRVKPKMIVCEAGRGQKQKLSALATDIFLDADVVWEKDLAGIDRVLLISAASL